jgi:putative flippase GtrA
MTRRLLAYITGGAIGFVLQIGALTLLTTAMGWPYALATASAVELAVIHNFWWHERRTFSDRRVTLEGTCVRLLKYHVTTGLASLVGNVALTVVATEVAGLHFVAANAAAVLAMTAANFIVADRVVFTRKAALPVAALAVLWPAPAAAAGPGAQTIAAWDQYVVRAETHLHQSAAAGLQGSRTRVPDGTVHHWRGSTIVRHTTVDRVIDALMHPGTPPPQEDVLESRVIARSGDSLRVYLKLSRHAVVTVVYDTEHDVSFRRHSPALATSRSLSTRIDELGGEDHGFLWRLNSYWRYAQVGDDVRIDVESLSLSRDVPPVVRPVAGPLIARIGRESLSRTLDAVRRFLENRRAAARQPPSALTVTPAAVSPSRSFEASTSAPGVSL